MVKYCMYGRWWGVARSNRVQHGVTSTGLIWAGRGDAGPRSHSLTYRK